MIKNKTIFTKAMAILIIFVVVLSLIFSIPIQVSAGNSFLTATEFTINENGVGQISGSVSKSNEQQFYKFTLSEPGKVKMTFNYPYITSGFGEWVVTLMNSNQTTIESIKSQTNTDYVETFNHNLSVGTYYVKVYGEAKREDIHKNYKLLKLAENQ